VCVWVCTAHVFDIETPSFSWWIYIFSFHFFPKGTFGNYWSRFLQVPCHPTNRVRALRNSSTESNLGKPPTGFTLASLTTRLMEKILLPLHLLFNASTRKQHIFVVLYAWQQQQPAIQQVQASSLTFRIRHIRCYSNHTHAPIANPPNSAQLGDTPPFPQSYIRLHAVVWECSEGQTGKHTDGRRHNVLLGHA